jgi:hypothetical protein
MPLTWRNVDAPDFRSSMEGYRSAADMIGGALSGLQGNLRTFDNGLNDQANTALMLKMAGIQDADTAKATLATLASDPDARRYNAAAIANATARPGALIAQAAGEQGLKIGQQTMRSNDLAYDQNQYGFGQIKAADAAAPIVMAVRTAMQSGDRAGAEKLLAGNPALMGSLGYKNTNDFLTALQNDEQGKVGIDSGRVGIRATELGMDQTRLNMSLAQSAEYRTQKQFNYQVEDRNDLKMGQQAFLGMASKIIPGDKESALAAFNSPEFARLTPGARMAAFNSINSVVGNLFEPSQLAGMAGYAGTPAGGGGSGDGMNVMNYEARNGGFGSVPSNIKTMGDASSYADSINARGIGSSAMGPYQIVGNTRDGYAKKLFGDGWRGQAYSPENELKIATAIFNDNKGSASALRKQWVSLSPGEAESVRKMAPVDALAYIARKESGAAPNTGSPASLVDAAKMRLGQDRNGRSKAADLISAGANGPNNSLDAAKQLATDPTFKGTNVEFLKKEIDGMTKRGVPIGTAMTILKESTTRNENSWLSPDVGVLFGNTSVRINKNGDRLDRTRINEEIARYSGGQVLNAAQSERDIVGAAGIQEAAQQKAAAATARYRAAIETKQRTGQGDPNYIAARKAEMDIANAGLIAAGSKLSAVATPRTTPPVATSTGQPSGGFWGNVAKGAQIWKNAITGN